MNPKRWYNMKKSGDNADVYIYSEIGFFGISASQFITDLAALDSPKTITLHINSVGGEVWDGMAIYNTLVQHPAKINVVIEGVAASIASVIAMAGDKVSMFETAMFMVHKPWTVAVGDSSDMEKSAEVLDKIQEAITAAYLSKAKDLTRADIEALIDEESWMLPEEAKEKGFIDKIIKRSDDEKAADKADVEARIVDCRGLVEQFKNAPQRIAALVRNAPPSAKVKTEDEKKIEALEIENSALKQSVAARDKAINLLTL